jgi:hypothetical protein
MMPSRMTQKASGVQPMRAEICQLQVPHVIAIEKKSSTQKFGEGTRDLESSE